MDERDRERERIKQDRYRWYSKLTEREREREIEKKKKDRYREYSKLIENVMAAKNICYTPL